jgi:hypothetical protein
MDSAKCDLMSPRQLAKQSGWPERRIRALIAQNRIKHIRVGASNFLPANAIDEFIQTNMVTPGNPPGKADSNG